MDVQTRCAVTASQLGDDSAAAGFNRLLTETFTPGRLTISCSGASSVAPLIRPGVPQRSFSCHSKPQTTSALTMRCSAYPDIDNVMIPMTSSAAPALAAAAPATAVLVGLSADATALVPPAGAALTDDRQCPFDHPCTEGPSRYTVERVTLPSPAHHPTTTLFHRRCQLGFSLVASATHASVADASAAPDAPAQQLLDLLGVPRTAAVPAASEVPAAAMADDPLSDHDSKGDLELGRRAYSVTVSVHGISGTAASGARNSPPAHADSTRQHAEAGGSYFPELMPLRVRSLLPALDPRPPFDPLATSTGAAVAAGTLSTFAGTISAAAAATTAAAGSAGMFDTGSSMFDSASLSFAFADAENYYEVATVSTCSGDGADANGAGGRACLTGFLAVPPSVFAAVSGADRTPAEATSAERQATRVRGAEAQGGRASQTAAAGASLVHDGHISVSRWAAGEHGDGGASRHVWLRDRANGDGVHAMNVRAAASSVAARVQGPGGSARGQRAAGSRAVGRVFGRCFGGFTGEEL